MTAKTDRELLELAARAVGLSLRWVGDASTVPYSPEESAERGGVDGYMWNPLTDDGDAFRLAVKLQIHATYFPRLGYATAATCGLSVDEYAAESDAVPATSRAIVRAAAAIGETL